MYEVRTRVKSNVRKAVAGRRQVLRFSPFWARMQKLPRPEMFPFGALNKLRFELLPPTKGAPVGVSATPSPTRRHVTKNHLTCQRNWTTSLVWIHPLYIHAEVNSCALLDDEFYRCNPKARLSLTCLPAGIRTLILGTLGLERHFTSCQQLLRL